MRWLHLASAIALLGGVFYARLITGGLDSRFKPVAYGAIGAILVSGVYNFMSKAAPPPHYYAWLAFKVLLAGHVFANVILYRGKLRLLTGVLIAGAVILGISGYLRWISLP